MLFKQVHLAGIKEGNISLAFRKWKNPAAKAGSTIKTSVGLIEIMSVTAITENDITADDASKAGFDTAENLLQLLRAIPEGTLYKITVRYHSEDPRLQLRETKTLTPEEWNALKEKLSRLDKESRQGKWTIAVLKAIQQYPKLKAASLALHTRKEKEWLKLNVRKLKNLGLTISHEPGYSLSPLGEQLLEQLAEESVD